MHSFYRSTIFFSRKFRNINDVTESVLQTVIQRYGFKCSNRNFRLVKQQNPEHSKQHPAYTSNSWPAWKYDHYYGFIRMKVVGNKLYQRNVFLYPPVSAAKCAEMNFTAENLPKEGLKSVCGVNGAEKVFKAQQDAIDCRGNLAGPYPGPIPGTTVDTKTELIGDGSAILYQASFGSYGLIQSQLTTFPKEGERVRTAQGFFFGAPTYASFYREHRVSGLEEWVSKLEEIRAQFNILPDDTCKVDGSTVLEGEAGSCFDWFLLGEGDEFANEGRSAFCQRINGGDATYC